MNRLLLIGALGSALITFTSCTNDKMQVGGVPGWIEGGARIEDEPDPLAPDPRLDLDDDSEGGPVQFTLITDKRDYPDPPAKKAEKPGPDPLERGRDYRIKRLVR